MFKVQDFWGIIAGMFLLIFAYLVLTNYKGFSNISSGLFSGTTGLAKVLQGR